MDAKFTSLLRLLIKYVLIFFSIEKKYFKILIFNCYPVILINYAITRIGIKMLKKILSEIKENLSERVSHLVMSNSL